MSILVRSHEPKVAPVSDWPKEHQARLGRLKTGPTPKGIVAFMEGSMILQ